MDTEQKYQIFTLVELARTLQEMNPPPFRNSDRIRQASVALIFRFAPNVIPLLSPHGFDLITNETLSLKYKSLDKIMKSLFVGEKIKEIKGNLFEILFIQRAYNKKDRHSGQIAFPGGKCDGSETDMDAVIRELKEEIGLDLLQTKTKIRFLGKSHRNFSHSPQMSCTLSFFFDFAGNEIIVNPSEIQDFKWIPANKFFNLDRQIVGSYNFHLPYLIRTYSSLPEKINEKISENYLNTSFPAFDIGMKVILWGFTLEMMLYVLEIFHETIRKCKIQEITNYAEKENIADNLKFGINSISKITTNFKMGSPKGIEKLGSLFDFEWKVLIRYTFGLRIREIKSKINLGIKILLHLMILTNLKPKI